LQHDGRPQPAPGILYILILALIGGKNFTKFFPSNEMGPEKKFEAGKKVYKFV